MSRDSQRGQGLCFYYAQLDEINEDLLRRINDSGRLYLTKTRARGRIVIRFAIGQTYTTLRHVEEGWACIQETAAMVTRAAVL